MPPYKRGFIKDTATPGSVKQTRKRKIDSSLEAEKHLTENVKPKLRRRIRATEELYNIPVTSDETSESERRLTRSHKKTKRSFLPKINDIQIDQEDRSKSAEQATFQATKEPKKKRVDQTENNEIPLRQTCRSTRGSIKISETGVNEEISPKHNQKELKDEKGSENVNEDKSINEDRKELIINRKSSRIEVQQLEKEPVQIDLNNRRVTRTSYRKSLIKNYQNIVGHVDHSAKTDDDFISKESVHEILNCKSPASLKRLSKGPRLTYDVNEVKNSPAFIKNRRETYDVENAASVAIFTKTETELNITKDKKSVTYDEVDLETTFDKKTHKPKENSNDTKNDQNLKIKDTDESQKAQEIKYVTSNQEVVSGETENDDFNEEPNNRSNTTITKNNNLIDENIQPNKGEASKKVEDENNCININNSLNEPLGSGDITFTKSTDSENDITLKEIDENDKNVTSEIKKKDKKELIEGKRCEEINNSLNEPFFSKNDDIIERIEFENKTLKEVDENSKNSQLTIKDDEIKDSVSTNSNELKNILLEDKEGIVESENNSSTFIKATNFGLSQNNKVTDNNIITETLNLTYEKSEETKEINSIISDEINLTKIVNEYNSSIETTLDNGSNNTFATASDFDSTKNDSDNLNVTVTLETNNTEIVVDSFKTSECEKHSSKEILTNLQLTGVSPQNKIISTPPPLTPTDTDNDPKTPAAKIINRRSTFDIRESINHVDLLKSVCTPREIDNIKKRKYGESTPHPKKVEVDSVLENETICFVDSPEYISNNEKTTSDSDKDISDSIFEQKRISSINRLRKRRSKSLPTNNESLTEFLFNEKITLDDYGRNITKRKKVTFKQIDESVALSPAKNPTSKIPKKMSTSLPSLVQKYSHPTSMSTPKSNSKSGLNKSKETIKKVTRTKLPNFTEIHKKMFNKMEDIRNYSQRKAERSKLLLSGHKPTNNKNESGHSSQIQENKNSHKKDNGNCSQSKENEKLKKHMNFSQNSKPLRDSENVRKFGQIQNDSNTLLRFGKRNTNSTTNVENQLKIQENKPKNVTKFGFKIIDGTKIPTKEDQKKAFVGKTKIIKNNRDERRNHIQGVRSNRRFDLLMKMREKKN